MDLLDPFWNEGALNHPAEPWATCKSTKDGIILFRSMRSSKEELRCLGREVRQLMLWGLDYQERVDSIKPNEADGNNHALEWQALHSALAKRACCLWRRWEKGLLNVLHTTAEYVEGSGELDVNLEGQWKTMVAGTADQWGELLGDGFFVEEEEVIEDPEFPDVEDLEEGLNRLELEEWARL
ncbi:hypothetical protein DFH28DRAFT_900364 [Melampsora americana]|nr:hypothetical protein DFH28DRAFT_900364 [Melampsora americana]